MSVEKEGAQSKVFRERWEPQGTTTMTTVFLGIDMTDMMALTFRRLHGPKPTPEEIQKAIENTLKPRR